MKNSMIKPVVLVLMVIILMVVLLASACTSPASQSTSATTPASNLASAPKYGGTLKMIAPGGMGSDVGWPAEFMPGGVAVFQTYFETLLRGDSKGNVYPWLAESYKVADDLKSITFTLRKDVKFHDGSDFNAQVAKWNMDNYTANSAGAPPAGAPPAGAPPAGGPPSGGAPPAGGPPPGGGYPWTSVDMLDDYTIRVNLTQWQNTVMASFADTMSPAFMVSKTAFEKNGIDWMRQNPVGTGPFKFLSYSIDTDLKVVRNTDYWRKDKGEPYLDGVDFIFVVDPLTQKVMMQAGEADMMSTVAGKQTADMSALGLTVTAFRTGVKSLVPDTANVDSPWANQKFREAVEYAIDREAIAKALGYGYWQAPYQIPGRDTMPYNPNFVLGRQYDIDKAKQLLKDAGYPDGAKTTIIVCPVNTEKDIAVAMQADLAKVGIQVALDFPDRAKFTNLQLDGWHNAALFMPMPGQVNYNETLQWLVNVLSKSWLRTPEFMKAYQTSLVSSAADGALMRAATDILTKDASVIPINEDTSVYIMQPYVMGTGVGERSFIDVWNSEQAWLNK